MTQPRGPIVSTAPVHAAGDQVGADHLGRADVRAGLVGDLGRTGQIADQDVGGEILGRQGGAGLLRLLDRLGGIQDHRRAVQVGGMNRRHDRLLGQAPVDQADLRLRDPLFRQLDIRRLQGAVGPRVAADGVLALGVDQGHDDARALGLGEEEVFGVHLVLGEALEGHLGEGIAADLADQGDIAMAQGRLDGLERAGTGHGAGKGGAPKLLARGGNMRAPDG